MPQHYPKGRSDRVVALIQRGYSVTHLPSSRGKHLVQHKACGCWLRVNSEPKNRQPRFQGAQIVVDIAEDETFLCAWRHVLLCLGPKRNEQENFEKDDDAANALHAMSILHTYLKPVLSRDAVVEELGNVLADLGFAEAGDALQFTARRTT